MKRIKLMTQAGPGYYYSGILDDATIWHIFENEPDIQIIQFDHSYVLRSDFE